VHCKNGRHRSAQVVSGNLGRQPGRCDELHLLAACRGGVSRLARTSTALYMCSGAFSWPRASP
jgi:hypothetical protein